MHTCLRRRPSFRSYVQGYEPRATFPHHMTIHRLVGVIFDLQLAERQQRLKALTTEFKGFECIGLQMDMWTDRDTHRVFVSLNGTTVVPPSCSTEMKAPQLILRDEVLDFAVFLEGIVAGLRPGLPDSKKQQLTKNETT